MFEIAGGIILAVLFFAFLWQIALVAIYLFIAAIFTVIGFALTCLTLSWWPTLIGLVIGLAWPLFPFLTYKNREWRDERDQRLGLSLAHAERVRQRAIERRARQWPGDLARARRMGLLPEGADPAGEQIL